MIGNTSPTRSNGCKGSKEISFLPFVLITSGFETDAKNQQGLRVDPGTPHESRLKFPSSESTLLLGCVGVRLCIHDVHESMCSTGER